MWIAVPWGLPVFPSSFSSHPLRNLFYWILRVSNRTLWGHVIPETKNMLFLLPWSSSYFRPHFRVFRKIIVNINLSLKYSELAISAVLIALSRGYNKSCPNLIRSRSFLPAFSDWAIPTSFNSVLHVTLSAAAIWVRLLCPCLNI